MTQVVLPHTITAGTAASAVEVQENDVALRDVINGEIDTDNLADGAVTSVKFDGKRGTGSVAFASTNLASTTIAHGLGKTPGNVQITLIGSGASGVMFVPYVTVNDTNLTVAILAGTSTSLTVNFYWYVFG